MSGEREPARRVVHADFIADSGLAFRVALPHDWPPDLLLHHGVVWRQDRHILEDGIERAEYRRLQVYDASHLKAVARPREDI